jgi:hypothetical protein
MKGGERMNEHFILTFATVGGKNKQVRVPQPNRSLSPAIIQGAAIRMVNSNIFKTASGSITALKKVELQTVTRTTLI